MPFAYVLAGLGNPGSAYLGTRHNAGAAFVQLVADRHSIALDTKKYRSLVGYGEIAGRACLLALPQTYMNLSGQAVRRMLSYSGTAAEKLILVHDDLDLALGRIRLRGTGGSGGHRGIQSVIDSLQTAEFIRLRIGIGRPAPGEDAERYVLGRFAPAERTSLARAYDRAETALRTLIQEGLAKAMSLHNPA